MKQQQMEAKENLNSGKSFTLFGGTYSTDEAREILMELIHSGLQFHSIKKLRSFEQKGTEDTFSGKRIEEIEKVRKAIINLLNSDGKLPEKVRVSTVIEIEPA